GRAYCRLRRLVLPLLFSRRAYCRLRPHHQLVLSLLAVVTVVSLVFNSGVCLNVLVSLLIGLAIVLLHSAFRGTEDLYSDKVDAGGGGGGGLFSFVSGGPAKTGYSPI
ncbi:hypothetical protein LINPERPRIM_LOCUS23469, partial [Linum perenne]